MQSRDITIQRLGLMPGPIEHNQLARPAVRWQLTEQLGMRAGVEQSDIIAEWQRLEPRREFIVVGHQEFTSLQRLAHDPRGVERMKSFTTVLQNDNRRTMLNPRDAIAKTE